MKKNIIVPKYYKGIHATFKSLNKKIIIFGCDTETIDGEPISIQLYNPEYGKFFFSVNANNVSDVFLSFFKNLKMKSGYKNIIVFAHNLTFDLPILFYPIKEDFCSMECSFKRKNLKHNVEVDVICGNTFFATLRYRGISKIRKNGKNYIDCKRRVQIIDTSRYFEGSLEYLCETLQLPVKKLKKPENLGNKNCIIDDYFKRYAIIDAIAVYHIGKFIFDMHREFDIPLSVSVSQQAQRIFTRKFMPINDLARLPPKRMIEPFILSYHGGKNGFYLPHAQQIKNVTEIDVVSMYPWAMTQLPSWTEGVYRQTYEYEANKWGVYCFTGFVKNCKYPIIPNHDFKYKHGLLENVWVASPEFDNAIKHGEIIEIKDIKGIIFEPTGTATNPFIDYVKFFFDKKANAENEPKRIYYKKLGNCLYGKTMQNVLYRNEYDFEYELKKIKNNTDNNSRILITNTKINGRLYRAGGLFHPVIATWITSLARARLHDMEHEFEALDSSTDSVKTTKNITFNEKILGGLSVKNKSDSCIFLRNKCYMMLDAQGEILKDKYGREVCAHHGFGGKPKDLYKLWLNKATSYKYSRMTRLRESVKRAKKDKDGIVSIWHIDELGQTIKPFTFREIEAELKINYSK